MVFDGDGHPDNACIHYDGRAGHAGPSDAGGLWLRDARYYRFVSTEPTRVLMMDDRHDQPKGQYYPLATTGPAFANGLAWRNCERFMISPRHPDEVCADKLETAE